MYYRGAAIALLVYDITYPVHSLPFVRSSQPSDASLTVSLRLCDQPSFEDVRSWYSELNQMNSASEGVVLVIVGNKSDVAEKRQVATEVCTRAPPRSRIVRLGPYMTVTRPRLSLPRLTVGRALPGPRLSLSAPRMAKTMPTASMPSSWRRRPAPAPTFNKYSTWLVRWSLRPWSNSLRPCRA